MIEEQLKKILIVDDDPGIRVAVSMKLKMAGFDVAQATDGVEALDYLTANPADLAVVDVGMPRMDGYTLCQKLHELEATRDLPVVILTAQDMEIPADIVSAIGRHRFMNKPFSPRELLKVVLGLLESDGTD